MSDGGDRRRLELRTTFDAVADIYDAGRPSYPPALFDDLVSLARLAPGSSRLFEVGCGTGIATVPLAERGFAISCVELGPSLAAVARRRLAGFPDVSVSVGAFEEWPVDAASFDLVYAATSWRWVDPSVGWAKAHALLRPGGFLALWEAIHAFPAGFDPFFTEVQRVYEELGETNPGDVWPPPTPDEVPYLAAEIAATGLFDSEVVVRRYVWERSYSLPEYLALLDTFSGHIAMEPAKRRVLYDSIARLLDGRGPVRRAWVAVLNLAKSIP